MANEILSAKLCELEEKMNTLFRRIQTAENASLSELLSEIESLKKDCERDEKVLRERIRFSKADIMEKFDEKYGSADEAINEIKAYLDEYYSNIDDDELLAEDKLLMAEYHLDFAITVSQRALLSAMDAISVQINQEERRKPAID